MLKDPLYGGQLVRRGDIGAGNISQVPAQPLKNLQAALERYMWSATGSMQPHCSKCLLYLRDMDCTGPLGALQPRGPFGRGQRGLGNLELCHFVQAARMSVVILRISHFSWQRLNGKTYYLRRVIILRRKFSDHRWIEGCRFGVEL